MLQTSGASFCASAGAGAIAGAVLRATELGAVLRMKFVVCDCVSNEEKNSKMKNTNQCNI